MFIVSVCFIILNPYLAEFAFGDAGHLNKDVLNRRKLCLNQSFDFLKAQVYSLGPGEHDLSAQCLPSVCQA